MKPFPSEPVRLLEKRAGDPTEPHLSVEAEAQLRDLFAHQPSPQPLSTRQLARVRALVRGRTTPVVANWSVVAWGVAMGLVIMTASVGFARNGTLGARLRGQIIQAVQTRVHGVARDETVPSVPAPKASPAKPQVVATTSGPAPVKPIPAQWPALRAEEVATSGKPSMPTAPPARPRAAEVAPAPTLAPPAATVAAVPAPAPASPSKLALEAASLREVTELLRTPAGAQVALEKLRAHRARYPHGALNEEADLAELDGDVALGRRPEALTLVRALQQRGSSRPDELRVLYGELLASDGDCAGALAEWGTELPTAPRLAERALYGKASCFGALGRSQESREALGQYLDRFPGGRFAAQAKAALVGR